MGLFAEVSQKKGPFIWKPNGTPAKKSEYESNTSLGKFFECPVIYHQWYTQKFREPASKQLVFGRAYHGTLDNCLHEKAVSGLMIHPVALQRRIEEWILIETFYNGKEIDWKIDGPEESLEAYINMGMGLVSIWRQDFLPFLTPRVIGKTILSEAAFWLPMKGTKALYGKIDLITDKGYLVDHKTGSKTWEQLLASPYRKQKHYNGINFFDEDLQISIYMVAYESIVKDWPKSTELHRAITSSSPEVERIKLDYSVDEVQSMFDKVIKPAMHEIDEMWKDKSFPCRCGKHTTEPATAARPLATAEGFAAGTTEGPVTSNTPAPRKRERDKAKQESRALLLSDRTPPPPEEEIPF